MQFFKRKSTRHIGDSDAMAARPVERRIRLLLVDENPSARVVIARRLASLDYDVALAENGYAALNALVTRTVDIILIDMGLTMMPAITTMTRIREGRLASNACFVMLTGQNDSQSIVAALDAGADDHLVKPFDFDILNARLRHVFQRAKMLRDLGQHNAELDARIARRAVELGETRETLRELQDDRARLVASIQALHDEVERLNAQHA